MIFTMNNIWWLEIMTKYIFDSGIDTLELGLFHLNKYHNENKHKDLRFALILLDNAIELIVKKALIDKKIVVMKDWKLKYILECLSEVRKLVDKANVKDKKIKQLKDLFYINEIAIFHQYRNDAFHVGGIQKEENLLQIIPIVLQSCQSFLSAFFNKKVEYLDNYLSRLTRVIYPLETEYDQVIGKYGKIENKVYLPQAFEFLQKIIIHCSNNILGKKKDYTIIDIENAIEKLRKIKDLKHTFLEDMAPTIKEKFVFVRDIIISVKANLSIDYEIIIKAITYLNSIFSFFIEMYRLLEMGYITIEPKN